MTGPSCVLIAFAIYLLGITTGLRWARRVFPRYRDPNPFGELPPVQPFGAERIERIRLIHNTKPEARN